MVVSHLGKYLELMLKTEFVSGLIEFSPIIKQMKTPSSNGGKLRLAWDMVV